MNVENFKRANNDTKPLLIANIWDCISAKAAEKAGFKVAGTSSHAIANMLGYEDGENIPFDEMFLIISKIAKSTNMMVSVDLESGYSENPNVVAENVAKLVDVGVLGINLEDGLTQGKSRTLGNENILAEKIKAIKQLLKQNGKDIYINARIDTFTTKHPNALQETLKRITIYEQAGANGFFIPLLNDENDIQQVLKTTALPINVFMKEGLKTYEEFAATGIHRISYGNGVHAKVKDFIENKFSDLIENKKL